MEGSLPYDFQSSIRSKEAYDVQFTCFSAEEIRKVSVQEITQPVAFAKSGGPYNSGVHAPKLGYFGRGPNSVPFCRACGLAHDCPGHMGHVELAATIYNPFMMIELYKLLRRTCIQCGKLKINASVTAAYVEKLRQVVPGEVVSLGELNCGRSGGIFSDCGSDTTDTYLKWQIHGDSDETSFYASEILKARDGTQHQESAKGLKASFKESQDAESKCPNQNSTCTKHQGVPDHRYSAAMERVRELLAEFVAQFPSKCGNCGAKGAKFIRDKFIKIGILQPGQTADMVCPAYEAKRILTKLWEHEKAMLDWMLPCCRAGGPEIFFLDAILIPPNRFRPTSPAIGDTGADILSKQTDQVMAILQANQGVKEALASHEDAQSQMAIVNASLELQTAVNSFMDSTKGTVHASKAEDGIRQLIEKKEGLFRMKMMGKRVNFAARSVISPDLNIETEEIGIPVRVASQLLYPEVAAAHNVHALRRLVKRGDVYPGAAEVHIPQRNGGKVIQQLGRKSEKERAALAKQLVMGVESGHAPYTVMRHIRNGDPMLVNRQPTLHKPGIMAHIARVLRKEKTIRLHYANCNTYNADFDGDEMNLHAPQDPVSRIEALEIARADQQYLVPTSGNPLRGLIQDHVIAGVMLSKRDTFLGRSDMCLLLYTGLRAALEKLVPTDWDINYDLYEGLPWQDRDKGRSHLMRSRVLLDPPAIQKPLELWTGKQVFSMLLKNIFRLYARKSTREAHETSVAKKRKGAVAKGYMGGGLNFDSISKTPGDIWNGKFDGDKEESTVLFVDTDLLMGVLDKNQFGATSFGLMHCIFELVGARAVGAVLASMGRLFSTFLQMRGFTCAFRDLVLRDEVDVKRRETVNQCRATGRSTMTTWLRKHGEGSSVTPDSTHSVVQAAAERVLSRKRIAADDVEGEMLMRMKNCWGDVVNACYPAGTKLTFPANCFAAMVQTGAKGSKVNQSMITCCLGQQELEGRQPPLTITRRGLPCFAPYDFSGRARGYITDRFLTGIRPQEFFFHCMAGREGLVDTAVKTSRSGYLQRCLVKHLESLKVCYDQTVRDADGSVVQFLYGEDGVDVTLASHLFRFDILCKNFDLLGAGHSSGVPQLAAANTCDTTTAPTYLKVYAMALAGDLEGAAARLRKLLKGPSAEGLDGMARSSLKAAESHLLSAAAKGTQAAGVAQVPDPLSSVLMPSHFFGCTSERHESELDKFLLIAKAKGVFEPKEARAFREHMRLKFMRCMAQPGEAVGVIAAQSMGEPSTQMTLNTFHLAGHGGANVTLGIPRLREIIQTAAKSNSTPLMKVEVLMNKKGSSDLRARRVEALMIVRQFRRVSLLDCLQRIVVHDKTRLIKGKVMRLYHVRLEFWPLEELFVRVPHLNRARLELYVETVFSKQLKAEVVKLSGASSKLLKPSVMKSAKSRDEGNLEEENDDGEAPASKRTKKRKLHGPGGRGLREQQEDEADEAQAEAAADAIEEAADEDDDDRSGLYQASNEEADADIEGGMVGVDHIREEGDQDDDENLGRQPAGERDSDEDEAEGPCDDDSKDTGLDVKMELGPPKAKKPRTTTPTMSRHPKVDRTGRGGGVFEAPDTEHIVSPKTWGVDSLSFLVAISNEVCSHRLLIPEVIYAVCAKVDMQDPECEGVKASSIREERGRVFIECEGVKLQAFHNVTEGLVDVNCIRSNDIRAILHTYGIEAARASIVMEVKAVFGHYGIQVDHRHLSLIADYMTQGGQLKPFSRHGFKSNMSPLQQMSFETTMQFMTLACQDNVADMVQSPAASLVLGQPPCLGTGMVSLLCDLNPRCPIKQKHEFRF